MDDYTQEKTAHQTLTEIIDDHRRAGRVMPHGLSLDPSKAASEWIAMQERQRPNQHRRDYIEQVTDTLKQFLKLKKPDQITVIACAEDSVYWRGDGLNIFFFHEKSIYHETMKMREDPAAYKSKSRKKLEDLT